MQQNSFDTSLRPQDDFFGYVNNPWLQANPIPASENSWGTFYVLRDQAWKAVSEIVQSVRSKEPSNESDSLLRKFFDAAMEFNEHADNHLQSLASESKLIDAISSPHELAAYLGSAHRKDLNMFWMAFVGLDDKDSSNQVLALYQRGLGLPNRDYYLEDEKRMKEVRTAYETFHSKLSPLVEISSDWKTVFELEKNLATASWTDIALRDVEKNYNRYTLAELKSSFEFDWDAYFAGLGWHMPSDNLVVSQPSFVTHCIEAMRDLEATKEYLKWRLASSFAGWVSEQTAAVSFDFYGKVLGGMTEQKPLWKRAVLLGDSLVIGEALGRAYAAKYFPETSKQAVLSLVEDIRRAYHGRIDALTWMSDETKKRAHTKLDNIKVFIGYPTVWRDLTNLTFVSDNVIQNVLRAREIDSEYHLAKVGTPPAEEEWEMFAHTVNAYHHPNRLEIVFPAAILQAPFYDPSASYASNLGGIGAVIGHEFTHGFDDQGAQFDEHGNVVVWQTESERAEFKMRAQLIVEQADQFETLPGVHLQGELVLGEAIADVGGLQLAVEALKIKDTSEEALKDLFVNFARAECGQATDELKIQLAKTDPHPPSRFRVNCVVNHVDDFYETYDVQTTDALFRTSEQRSQIW